METPKPGTNASTATNLVAVGSAATATAMNSSTSYSSARERRLEAEIEQYRLEKKTLERDLRTAHAKAELFENKAKRAQNDFGEAQTKVRTLEQEVLRLRQETDDARIQFKEETRDLSDQFTIERKALENALEEAMRREDQVRNQERLRSAELQAARELLEEEKKRESNALMTSKKKRTRSAQVSTDQEGVQYEEELMDLKRKVISLEAENRALEAGAAVTERMTSMREALADCERRERRLKEEVDSLSKERQLRLEASSQLDQMRAKAEILTREVESLLKENSAIASVKDEIERWRLLFPSCSSPSDAAIVLSALQENVSKLQEVIREMRQAGEAQMRKEQDLRDKLSESDKSISRARQDEEKANARLAEVEKQLEQCKQSRAAAERALSALDPLKPGSADGSQSKVLSDSLDQARMEIKELELHCKRLQEENERLTKSVGVGAFDPSKTRVLHIKSSMRADRPNSSSVTSASQGSQQDEYPTATRPGEDSETARKRLKEQFKHHVLMYKEAVYLLFGWKVEMTTDTLPLLRLRSRYAERADDFLLFRFNPKESFLELIETDFGKTLLNTPSYLTYLVHADSIPSFLGALQLDLFGQQTMM